MAPFAIVKNDEQWFDGGRDSLLYIDTIVAWLLTHRDELIRLARIGQEHDRG